MYDSLTKIGKKRQRNAIKPTFWDNMHEKQSFSYLSVTFS
ncbi:hypothetical protein HMPREF0645_2433 [Hallella bergensis DSM 17361]|uniref:Uncharacterized protein n=1 Tax=Hallella bergensis DSM 17361 TaxID=585502 RepID=D1PZP8_9BACT|nr:hypothetical protein HMPREF0645_2433 [Hallella bergensis DSM 17361]